MNIPNDILEKNISELFGFSELAEEERNELLDGIGSALMESALLRYYIKVGEEEMRTFEAFIDAHKEEDDMLLKLIETYPTFKELLKEEVVAMKQEAEEVLNT